MDSIRAILQNPIVLVSLVLLVLFYCGLCLWLHFYKIKRMLDNDASFEERYENGNIKFKGYHRNIWDLSMFPEFSKLFFVNDWKIAIATFIFMIFVALYLVTKEQWFAELIKVNFGLVVGALIGTRNN